MLPVLRAGKYEEPLEVASIGLVQSCGVELATLDWVIGVDLAPAERLLAQPLDKQIGQETRMAAIPVRERMDQNQLVVEPNRQFIRLEGGVANPVVSVSDEQSDFLRNPRPIDPDVLVRAAISNLARQRRESANRRLA